jgi:hypothetical protein
MFSQYRQLDRLLHDVGLQPDHLGAAPLAAVRVWRGLTGF